MVAGLTGFCNSITNHKLFQSNSCAESSIKARTPHLSITTPQQRNGDIRLIILYSNNQALPSIGLCCGYLFRESPTMVAGARLELARLQGMNLIFYQLHYPAILMEHLVRFERTWNLSLAYKASAIGHYATGAYGTWYGSRTRVTAVKGRCLDHSTNQAY